MRARCRQACFAAPEFMPSTRVSPTNEITRYVSYASMYELRSSSSSNAARHHSTARQTKVAALGAMFACRACKRS